MNLTDLLQHQLELGKNPHPTEIFNTSTSSSYPSNSTGDLFQALDDITDSVPTKTAASILLEEKKRIRQKLNEIESTNFAIPRETTALTPLLQQVADNNQVFDFTKHLKKSNQKKQKMVYQTSKKSNKLKEKGESYQDRLKEKLSKQKLKQKGKK